MTSLTSYFNSNATENQRKKLELLDVNLLMLDYKFQKSFESVHITCKDDFAIMSIYSTVNSDGRYYAIVDNLKDDIYRYAPARESINTVISLLKEIKICQH